MKLKLKIDPERITLDDMIMLEDGMEFGHGSMKKVRGLISRFIVDESGAFIPEDQALTLAGKLTMSEIQQVVQQLSAGFKVLQEKAIPPDSAASS